MIFEKTPGRLVLPVRDGAYLAVFARPLRRQPRITVVLDDGTRVRESPSSPPIPGTLPPPRPRSPSVKRVPIETSAREIGPDGSVLVTFRAPLPIRDVRTFYRAEANGPHAKGCAGRVLAATSHNYDRGDKVHLRLRTRPWCRGRFRGRVSIDLRTTVGTFALTVR